jgi:hypothetical protein
VQALIQRFIARGGLSVLEGLTLLTFCPFNRFCALQLSAEYVFYWNALSHSMFLRLFNAQPVFLFDRGHLVRNVTPLYERIVQWYYQGREPIYLEPDLALSSADLAVLAERYRDAARGIVADLRRSPSPDAMATQIASHKLATSR